MADFLPSLLLTFISAMSLALTNADPRTDLVYRYCGTHQAQDPVTFSKNFEHAMLVIPHLLRHAEYATPEFGQDPNRVYVIAQCMDDLNSEECGTCFDTMRTLLNGCLPKTSARVYLDGCFARFENYTFYHETLSEEDQKRCSTTSTPIDAEEYRNLVRHVVSGIADVAPEQSNFAVDKKNEDFMSVYGLGTCMKTLDSKSCSICLEDAATSAYTCLPAAEGRALNAGCFLRYSIYEFVNSPEIRDARETVGRYISYTLASVAICSVALFIGCTMGKLCYRRSIDKRTKVDLCPLNPNLLQFKGSTLEKATKNFNEEYKIGSGGYGEVFKGTLEDGREIAIKRLYVSEQTQVENIYNEMDVISRAQHKNLVLFLGCCFCNFGSFLLYEYLPNKSLDRILFDSEKKKKLDWTKRLGIIVGTAEGLKYLHKDCKVRVIHRDIKASNILLDLKHRPKISDFGLARLMACDKSFISTPIAGTVGYMAPEYIARGRLTEKVDVYSFGVLVLEIVSGVQNNKLQSEESFDTLVTQVWRHFQSNTVSEIIDQSMGIQNIEEIKRVAQIGLLCTQESPSLRPNMSKVVQMLKQTNSALPTPSKPPFTDEDMELLGSSRRKHSSSVHNSHCDDIEFES